MTSTSPPTPCETSDGDPPRTTTRDRVAFGGLLGMLLAANIARSTIVPEQWHFPYNAGIGVGAATIAVFAGLSRSELGLERGTWRSGARVGGVAFGIVSAAVITAGATGLLGEGVREITAAQMLWHVAVVIPVSTVAMEELAFRGVLPALLHRVTRSQRWTMVAGPVVFGLWHIFPAARGGAVDVPGTDVPLVGLLVGTFVATSVAGVVFDWLRRRSDSLLAPALLHFATNSVTFAMVWLVSTPNP